MGLVRLARRFFASVFARSPGLDDQAWVRQVLEPGEYALWEAQPRYDRSHSIGVARRVEYALGDASQPEWLAAALLHDVGKVQCGLGITGRVVGTLLLAGGGRDRVRGWADRSGWRGRFGRYATHGELGGAMIRGAGGREPVAQWAEWHHRLRTLEPGALADVPASVATVLKDCDRD